MVLDACGNVYVVDQGASKLYRVRLDEAGVATQAPELLATFPTNVANAPLRRRNSRRAEPHARRFRGHRRVEASGSRRERRCRGAP
jgi:hypothetical protein